MTELGEQTTHSSGILIRCVRVRNFRCLREIEVLLTPMTVLIGENNAGKTSFLDAIFAAVGSGTKHLSEDDIYIEEDESKPPRDREIVVDLLIRPISEDGKSLDGFPQGSPWLELWGNGIVQDDDDNDFVGIRMLMSWDHIKGDYSIHRRFLREWKSDFAERMDADTAQHVSQVTAAQIAPLSLYFLDAKRDAAEEMRARGSIWNKLISDHGISEEDVHAIEQQLSDINSLLVSKSGVLTHLQQHLNQMSNVINCDEKNVAVNPVARRLRDLSKGIDVVLSTPGAPQFPLSRQGMGTRSLASVFLFRAYMAWRQKEQATEALHPFLAIEEPEAHLHPQAQRSLFQQLMGLPGQRLVSTHSPYVCSQADIASFVHFFKDENDTSVTRFNDPNETELTSEDLRKINRQVMKTRGDLLFSRCVMLFEGETEEQALPAFAHRYWGRHPNDVGISFISVDGSGNYLPFLRLTTKFRIPWVIFSDGDAASVAALDNALSRVGQPMSSDNRRCIVLPDGKSFEEYLLTTDALTAIQEMIADYKIKTARVTDQVGKDGITNSWSGKSLHEVLDELRAHKTTYGAMIADAYAGLVDAAKRTPAELKKAFDVALPPTASDSENATGA